MLFIFTMMANDIEMLSCLLYVRLKYKQEDIIKALFKKTIFR